jgi:hypothetical protein
VPRGLRETAESLNHFKTKKTKKTKTHPPSLILRFGFKEEDRQMIDNL